MKRGRRTGFPTSFILATFLEKRFKRDLIPFAETGEKGKAGVP